MAAEQFIRFLSNGFNQKRSRFGSVSFCSMDPVDQARELLPGNGDLRSEQDRKMGFCEFNQIRRRYQRSPAPAPRGCIFLFSSSARSDRFWLVPGSELTAADGCDKPALRAFVKNQTNPFCKNAKGVFGYIPPYCRAFPERRGIRQSGCRSPASSLRTMLTTQRLLFTRIKPITHLMSSSEQHTI